MIVKTPLERIGVSNKKCKQFAKSDIFTAADLIKYFPKKYNDYRKSTPINSIIRIIKTKVDKQVEDGVPFEEVDKKINISVVGRLIELKNKPHKNILIAKIDDGSRRKIKINWFSQNYLANQLEINKRYIVCGDVEVDSFRTNKGDLVRYLKMTSPDIISENIEKYQTIIPKYKKIKGMSREYLEEKMNVALKYIPEDYLSEKLRESYNLIKHEDSFRQIHRPKTIGEYKEARNRFIFDDMFMFAFQMRKKQDVNLKTKYTTSKFKKTKILLDKLAFELTDDQSKVLRKISKKMLSSKRCNDLIQGDVGCGKTIIAILLLVIIAENGFQGALIAPTNILANQHFEEAKELLEPLGLTVGKLDGNLTKKEKEKTINAIANGDIQITIGTHAVIQESVSFKDLGLLIVDEQHRFGVEQKDKLIETSKYKPHKITMSATPIPRTLSMTLYGGVVDVHNIKTLPNGRKPVKTTHTKESGETYEFIEKEIQKGRQCYIVCPLVEDSEHESMQAVKSAHSVYEEVSEHFKNNYDIHVDLVTGKLKKDEADKRIIKFSNNKTQILVSTTVIEVGVNVPNASVMVIKTANRFGLSQLHQLRGRVGRGAYQSYCILECPEDNPKIEAMTEHTDGFVIAKKDLGMRGAGDFLGTKQSGNNKYIELMIKYEKSYKKVLKEVEKIYSKDKLYKEYSFINELDLSGRMLTS